MRGQRGASERELGGTSSKGGSEGVARGHGARLLLGGAAVNDREQEGVVLHHDLLARRAVLPLELRLLGVGLGARG